MTTLSPSQVSHRVVISNVSHIMHDPQYIVYNATADRVNGVRLEAEIIREIPNLFMDLHFSMFSIRRGSETVIFDKKMVDFCKFLNNTSVDILLHAAYDMFRQNSNFTLSCPMKKVCSITRLLVRWSAACEKYLRVFAGLLYGIQHQYECRLYAHRHRKALTCYNRLTHNSTK